MRTRCLALLLLLALAPSLVSAQPALPVTTIRGGSPGPTVALVAGVHGGKVSAIRALEQLAEKLKGMQDRLSGRVIIVPIANVAGYEAGLAQTSPSDGLNLNRVFPGDRDGSPTERLAARILYEVVAGSDYLVDLHGSDGNEAVGSFAYAARPGIDPAIDSAALDLARLWGVPHVVWDTDGPRTLAESMYLQTAAHLSRVPAITVFEAGATREDPAATAAFLAGAERLLGHLGVMVLEAPPPPMPVVHSARDVTLSATAGHWEPAAGLRPGAHIEAGEPLGTLTDTSGVGGASTVLATIRGIVLHQRLAGDVEPNTPLTILAVRNK